MDINKLLTDFFRGECVNAYEYFGAHKQDNGVVFRVYAPHAYKIALVSLFDRWQEHYMEKIDKRGIWELYIEGIEPVHCYRYRIYKDEKNCQDKSDPYAFYAEVRPANASIMYDLDYFKFDDDEFMKNRSLDGNLPLNIYEVHPNGFVRDEGAEFSSYKQLKEELLPYVLENGFNAIELMPISEHPFDGSWGYQSSGMFAATSRYGTPYDLMDFINTAHHMGIKVILDVVYLHFATDAYALGNFDFGPVYEYQDSGRQRSEWDTYYFDLGNPTVMSFLQSSAHFYGSVYHFDGIRVDAVSHFLYRKGNTDLGENPEGINFLKKLNYNLHKNLQGFLVIAEDSSAFAKVTVPVEYGGIGFDYKWDLGWMNDTLKYYALDPVYKKWHHNSITFSMAYFFNEKFMCVFSHDEVVHGKKTIIDKMYGTYEEKFALCKNLYIYMYTHPGKKLNFMGNEIASFREFDEKKQLDWFLLDYPVHDSFRRFNRDVNNIYLNHKALYEDEYNWEKFKWIEVDNADQSIFSYYREADDEIIVTVLNMTPNEYHGYKMGVPVAGEYVELINTEKDIYSGNNMCNFQPCTAMKAENGKELCGMPYTIDIDLASFAGIIFYVKKPKAKARKTATKKATTKTVAKKETVKKTTSKAATKKEPAKKEVKKEVVKKATVKKETIKKAEAKKATVKKAVVKKVEPKKTTAKKVAVKKEAVKKKTAKKSK